MRTIIVHYHIFKNAGSSIDHILRTTFGDRWASLEGATPTSLLQPGDLSAFVQDQPEICAISSHLLRPPAPTDLNVIPVVLIRHPLDRAFSVYSHKRRSPTSALYSEQVAQRAGFRQFVRWCLNNKSLGGVVISNYQVVHLSPASFRGGHIFCAVATEADLQYAIDYLSADGCSGTVDNFNAAITKLRKMSASIALPIRPTTAIENATPGRPHDLETRLSIAREQLGPVLYQRFRQENALDYDLYEWALTAHS